MDLSSVDPAYSLLKQSALFPRVHTKKPTSCVRSYCTELCYTRTIGCSVVVVVVVAWIAPHRL